MKTRELTVFLLLGIVFHSTIIAGTSGKIVGTVKDAQTGEPLIGASVVIEGTTLGAATNIDGYYVILNIPPGKYSLVASAVGYAKNKLTNVGVSVDLTTKQDFSLQSSVVEGEEVVITAERPVIRKDLTSSEARVDASQIKSLPVREVNEVLSIQSGITVDRDGGIHIRGGRTSEVAYWVDGVSLSDVYDGRQSVQLDNNSVQELQVISGTYNAEYGQAMSGIVNIVTKDGEQKYHGSLSGYTGDYVPSNDGIFFNGTDFKPTAKYNVEGSLSGPISSNVTFYVSGRYIKTDGWLYGNRVFKPEGGFAPGADSLKDARGNIIGYTQPGGPQPVPMNNRERVSGQAKLTWALSGVTKLSLSGLYSHISYRDYNHGYRLNPDGNVKKFDKGYNVAALWTHSLSATSFYTVNLAYFLKDFRERLFEDPFSTSYILDPQKGSTSIYEFQRAGTNNHQFKRSTETRVAKMDFTNQLSKLHQLKAGLEGKLHRLYLEDYNVTFNDSIYSATQKYVNKIPERNGPNYQEYTEQPVEFSAYIQDKLEYDKMIVNIGLRYDYFNAKGQFPADPQDPNVYLPQKPENQALSEVARLAKWYKKSTAKSLISPRFGISYPITDKGVLHFSYGHFLQIPSFIHLYQKPGYKVTSASGVQGVFGNPDLDAQKTVMYEFGLQQQLTDNLSVDVTGFYRDTRNWVTTSVPIGVRDVERFTSSYTMYVNRDYANSRGVTLSVNKRPGDMVSLNFSYTFQTAEGNNSNPDDEQAAQRDNKEPARALTPLEWDQTHTANLTLGVGKEDWGIFLLARYGSGLPYTPVINQAEARGEDAARAVQKNSRRRPENYTADLRMFKNFRIEPLNLSAFLKVLNLFDRRNELEVYGQTGSARATPQTLGIGAVGGAGRINTVEEYLLRPDFYSEPREIQLGVEVNF